MRWPTFLMLAGLGACVSSTGNGVEVGTHRVGDTGVGTETSVVSDGWSTVATHSENATTSVESTSVTLPVPVERSISILATGDVLPEGPVIAAAAIEGGFDFARLFEPVGALVAGVDLAICHLEIPIVDEGGDHGTIGRSPYGGNQLAAPHELADGLARTGFDRCSTASNHADDLAMDGVRSTLDALDAVGIGHSGTARSAEEATMWTQDVAGVSVAHLSYTTYSNNRSLSDEWALRLSPSASDIATDVRTARDSGAEVVIVSLHVSREMDSEPSWDDRRLVEEFTAFSDVDLVVMHGPHVVQPVETVNGALVYWSLGNFVSGMGRSGSGKYEDPRTLDGVVARVTIEVSQDGANVVDHAAVLVCTDPMSRRVHPATTTLASTVVPESLRRTVEECFGRSVAVIPDLR